MNVPESMKLELAAWNSGDGVDLETWVGCTGNFALAVGYGAIFCPNFIEFEDYIFIGEDMPEDAIKNLRGFESRENSNPRSIEWVLNHIHLVDLHYRGCPDASADKLILLDKLLKETYEARLQYFFPSKPCVVEFYQPENPEKLEEYQLSFWQKKHDKND